MDDYDELGSYNGDVEHDMWVDYDHYQNTGEPDVFDEEDIDDIVDDLDDLIDLDYWDLDVPAPPSGYRKSSQKSRPKGFYP